jgi:hypothetical protein
MPRQSLISGAPEDRSRAAMTRAVTGWKEEEGEEEGVTRRSEETIWL